MTALDAEQVLAKMLEAASEEFADAWSSVKAHVTDVFERLAQTSGKIVKFLINGEIGEDEAIAMIAGVKAAARDTLLAIRDVAKITIIKAWNAAVGVLHSAIEKSVDMAIPV